MGRNLQHLRLKQKEQCMTCTVLIAVSDSCYGVHYTVTILNVHNNIILSNICSPYIHTCMCIL